MIKSFYESFCGDWQDTILPFEIFIHLPKAKKERIIFKRDSEGRILQSIVPEYF